MLVHYVAPAARAERRERRAMVRLDVTPAEARRAYRNWRKNSADRYVHRDAAVEDARAFVLAIWGVPLVYREVAS